MSRELAPEAHKVEARETWRNGAALVEVDARSLPPPNVLTGSLG